MTDRLEKKITDERKRLVHVKNEWARVVRNGAKPRLAFANRAYGGKVPKGDELDTATRKRRTRQQEERFGYYVEHTRRATELAAALVVYSSLAAGQDETPLNELLQERQDLAVLAFEGYTRFDVEAKAMLTRAKIMHTLIGNVQSPSGKERLEALTQMENFESVIENSVIQEAGLDARIQAGIRSVVNNRISIATSFLDTMRLDFGYMAAGGRMAPSAVREMAILLEASAGFLDACDEDLDFGKKIKSYEPPCPRLN